MSANTYKFESKPGDIAKIVIFILAVFSICLFLASLYHRIISNDDAFFAELAYWFAHDGYVHTELFEGVPVFSDHVLVYARLHIWQGALVYKLFGWNVYYFKSISLFYLIIFLALVFYFLKHLDLGATRITVFTTFLFLLFANHEVVQKGFEYRPEIPMMCIGFLSYIFLRRTLIENKALFAVLAGVMAGITVLFHLTGLIFIAAGALLLLYHRQLKLSIWFGVGAILLVPVYFYHITTVAELHNYLYQLAHNPAVSHEDRTISGMLFKLLTEYRRFTHHIYEFVYLVLFIVTLMFNWHRLTGNSEYKNLLLYTLFLTIFMALITTGSKTMYLLYSMPYVLLIIATQFPHAFSRKRLFIALSCIIGLYFLVNLDKIHGVMVDKKNYPPQLFAKIVDKYHMKRSDHIFAPDKFIFNEMGRVHIQCYWAYEMRSHIKNFKITVSNLFSYLYKNDKSYAIISESKMKLLKFTPRKNHIYYGYKYLNEDGGLYIFKRIANNNSVLKKVKSAAKT